MESKKTPERPLQETPITPPATAEPTVEPQPQQPAQSLRPQVGQPQYIVTHRSLEGVGGWLAFWVVLFALIAIGGISLFFSQLSGEVELKVVDVIFAPIITIMYVAAILMIVTRKKLGKWLAVASLSVSGLYSMISVLTTPIDNVASIISSILILWLIVGLLALYFLKSERVKQTLTK